MEEGLQSSLSFPEPEGEAFSHTQTQTCSVGASKGGRNSYFLTLVLSSESYLVVIRK